MVVTTRRSIKTQIFDKKTKIPDVKFARLLYDEYYLDARGKTKALAKTDY